MTKKKCQDCRCEAASHTKERQGRHLVTEETNFPCGACQKERLNLESGTGIVEFRGCNCAS